MAEDEVIGRPAHHTPPRRELPSQADFLDMVGAADVRPSLAEPNVQRDATSPATPSSETTAGAPDALEPATGAVVDLPGRVELEDQAGDGAGDISGDASPETTRPGTVETVEQSRFRGWVDSIKGATLQLIIDNIPAGATQDQIIAFVRERIGSHEAFLHGDEVRRNPSLAQAAAVALATYVESNLVPHVDTVSKAAVLALFTRYKMPTRFAVPLAEFAGSVIGGKIERASLDVTRVIKEKALQMYDEADGEPQRSYLARVLATIRQAEEDEAARKAAEGDDEEPDDAGDGTDADVDEVFLAPEATPAAGHNTPEVDEDGVIEGQFRELDPDEETDTPFTPSVPPAPSGGGGTVPPTPPTPPVTPVAPEAPGGGGGDEGDPEQIDGATIEAQLRNTIPVAPELVEEIPAGGELPDPDNYFMEKHRVNGEVIAEMRDYNIQARQNRLIYPPELRSGLSDADMNELGLFDVLSGVTLILPESEMIRRMAMNKVAHDRGSPVRYLVDGQTPIYYIEYNSRDWTECQEFGSGSDSLIVRLTRQGLTGNYDLEELMVLRTLDNRSNQFMMETYFEQYLLMKLQETRTEADGDGPLQVDQARLQEIFDEYRKTLYKVGNSLLASTSIGDDDKESDAEEAQIFRLTEKGLKSLRDRMKQRGFLDRRIVSERYNIDPNADFRVNFVINQARSNPRSADMPADRALDQGRDVQVSVRRLAPFNEAIRDELLPTLEAIRHTAMHANAGRERLLDPTKGIDQVIHISKLLDADKVAQSLSADPYGVMAMQEGILALQQVGAQFNRIPTERFGVPEERSGMTEWEIIALNAMLLRVGPRKGRFDELSIMREAIKKVGDFRVVPKQGESSEAFEERKENERRQWKEKVRSEMIEVRVAEKRRDDRHFADIRAATLRGCALSFVYTGEGFGYLADMVDQEALTADKLVGPAPLPGQRDTRRWEGSRTFADDMSGVMKKLREVLMIEREQFGQEVGDGIVGIPVNRNIGVSSTDRFTQADYDRLTALQRDARRNGASRELMAARRVYQFIPDIIRKPAGDITRLAGWRTNQLNQTILADLVMASERIEAEGLGRTEFILGGLQRFGGTRLVINYIQENTDTLMRSEGNQAIREFDAAKKAVEAEFAKSGKASSKTKERAHKALLALQVARDEAKSKYMSKYVFEGLLREQPSMALVLEHRSHTPGGDADGNGYEATVRQHLVTFLAEQGVPQADGTRRRIPLTDMGVIMNGVMPVFELSARHMERRLYELRRRPGGLTPAQEAEERAEMERNIRTTLAEWVKGYGYAINPATGEQDQSYRNIADILGSNPTDIADQANKLYMMFEDFHVELAEYVHNPTVARDRPLHERFGEGLALGYGSYDSQLTGHQMDYSGVQFNGRTIVEGGLGGLEARPDIKKMYAGLFGEGGVLAQIYFGDKPITTETAADHASQIAPKVVELAHKLAANPIERTALKAKLAVACVSALRGREKFKGSEALAFITGTSDLTIWDSKHGKAPGKTVNTADNDSRYALLFALCRKLDIPDMEFVADQSSATILSESDAQAREAAAQIARQHPALGRLANLALDRSGGASGRKVRWNQISLPLVVAELGHSERMKQYQRRAAAANEGLGKFLEWTKTVGGGGK